MILVSFLCQFHSRWVANANPVSGGIWAIQIFFKDKIDLHRQLHLIIRYVKLNFDNEIYMLTSHFVRWRQFSVICHAQAVS